ncbi:MAG: hypothetical protein LC135_01395 [Phycisphaerae bacterium]|nr:hypothetical protein [Phycisphaerae bacterium]MCZ2398507.1 hypothetical protein [Phycisphaerae bacterium]
MLESRKRAEAGGWRVAAAVWALAAQAAIGAPHRDWTVIPLGSFELKDGRQVVTIARPYDHLGIIRSPIVIVALFDPAVAGEASPAELSISAQGQRYPRWRIGQAGQVYVLGLEALDRDGSHEGRATTLTIEVARPLPGLALMVSGAPDLALAGPQALGPLEDVVAAMPRGEAREYLQATLQSAAADLAGARREIERLCGSGDETVARLARSARRRMDFALAESRAPATADGHYRLGLYAQQAGLFRSARLHLERALSLDVRRPEAWFRLGEVLERCGENEEAFGPVIERAGMAAGVQPATWNVLVVTIVGRPKAGASAGDGQPALTPAEVRAIRDQWRAFSQIILGASRGRLRLEARFVQLEDATAAGYRSLAYRSPLVADEAASFSILAPPANLLGAPGGVDWVVTFRRGGLGVTAGPDCGVGGAAISDVPAECGWTGLLVEFCRLVDCVGRYSELDELIPTLRHAPGCGMQPNPSLGSALRAGLGYHAAPEAFRRLGVAAPPSPAGYVQNWYVAPGRTHSGSAAAADRALSESVSPGRLEPPERFVESRDAFIDLRRVLTEARIDVAQYPVAKATTWVLSPSRASLRFWLTACDRAAVWLNDRVVHRGDVYLQNAWRDAAQTAALAVPVVMQKGWNRIDVVVERPAAGQRPFGFALRILTPEGGPAEELIQATRRTEPPRVLLSDPFEPRAGTYFRWADVRDDSQRRLPQLSIAALHNRGELPANVRLQSAFSGGGGVVVIGSDSDEELSRRSGVRLRAAPRSWDVHQDRDVELNNVLDWEREAVAVYPYRRNNEWRHLLLIKPEAVEPYLACLRESPQAAQRFAKSHVSGRVLGYVRVGAVSAWQWLIVVDTLLETPLPVDEEDLLWPV